MTDLRKAAKVPLHEQLGSVPENARLVIDSEDGLSTRYIPIGILCQQAAQALRQALAQPEQEPVEYKEECWACGCKKCMCATKVPGYYESKIKEAVLAEREACAKVCEETGMLGNGELGQFWSEKCAAAIRARSEK